MRDDCFAGERLLGLDDARQRGLTWYAEEYGRRTHSTTQRAPREHFAARAAVRDIAITRSASCDTSMIVGQQLCCDQAAVVLTARHQLVMSARFDDFAVFHHQDQVGVDDRA